MAALAVAPLVRMSSTSQSSGASSWGSCTDRGTCTPASTTKLPLWFVILCWRLRWCWPTVGLERFSSDRVVRCRDRQIIVGRGLRLDPAFQPGMGTRTASLGRAAPRPSVSTWRRRRSGWRRNCKINWRSAPSYQPAAVQGQGCWPCTPAAARSMRCQQAMQSAPRRGERSSSCLQSGHSRVVSRSLRQSLRGVSNEWSSALPQDSPPVAGAGMARSIATRVLCASSLSVS